MRGPRLIPTFALMAAGTCASCATGNGLRVNTHARAIPLVLRGGAIGFAGQETARVNPFPGVFVLSTVAASTDSSL